MAEQTNPPSAGVAAEPLTVEQRLANLYGAKIDAPAPPEQAAGPEPETVQPPVQEQDQGEGNDDELSAADIPDDGDGEAQPQTGDEFRIVHNGTEHKLDRAKTIELAQKGFDYTAKTQELAGKQRQADEILQRASELEALAPEIANEAALVRAAEQALAPWQNVDWVRLATDEPLEYARYRAQYDQLVNAYNMTRNQFQSKATYLHKRKVEIGQAVVMQEMQKLREFLPQLRDPEKFQAAAATMKSYGLADGYTAQEIEGITDARMVRTLWKAAQYDKLVKGKAEQNKQLRTAPPTTKPGAVGTTQSAEQQRTQQLRASLKKTGDWRDAASLLSRLK